MPTRAPVLDAALLGGALVLSAAAVVTRLRAELSAPLAKTVNSGLNAGGTWDPRGRAELDRAMRARESDSFRARLRSGTARSPGWPGLGAAEVSWTWLELLQGLHTESSYEGDFSWMFSKIERVIEASPKEEIRFVSTLSPFFFVIGQDPVGATVVMNELLLRAPDDWRSWFWSAYHANENLKQPRLAGDLLGYAARRPGSPAYTATLALRLSHGEEFLDPRERAHIIEHETDPVIVEKLRTARPEWFR